MTTMIEKVAKAIFEEMDLSDSLALPEAERYARAAIEAMREPTEAMLDAYWRQTGESKEMRSRTHAYMKRHFSTMIDAALSEEKAE